MREPPDLSPEAIGRALRDNFGIQVAGLVFLPVGEDSDSWAYGVEASDGTAYFLKVRAGVGRVPGAVVPEYLHRRGVPHVLAPLVTGTDAPSFRVDAFTLMLYPMIDGAAGAEVGLSPRQWRELGAVVRRFHTTPLPAALTQLLGREAFRPTRRDLIDDLDALVTAGRPGDPVARRLTASWRTRRALIGGLVEQADVMGRQLRQASFPLVLCHADLHTWNVLVDAEQRLWVVDWDEAILAPKERDLMFVVGGIVHDLVTPGDNESFFQGYGEATVDQRLLAYYRHAWAVQDIAAFAEHALLTPTLTAATRDAAVDGFMQLFEPGNIVDLAMTREGVGW
jgi:spectinomycin phosphotransferase